MEDALRETIYEEDNKKVLILILMEDALRD